MSVLIKGMEMPKSCYFCEMYEADLYWCSAAKRDIDSFDDYDNRSSFCPLVPVPPHGRLIDADALCTRLLTAWDTADKEKKTMITAVLANVVTPIVVGTPTIIPASGGAE